MRRSAWLQWSEGGGEWWEMRSERPSEAASCRIPQTMDRTLDTAQSELGVSLEGSGQVLSRT